MDPPAFDKGQGVLSDDAVSPAEGWDLPEEICLLILMVLQPKG